MHPNTIPEVKVVVGATGTGVIGFEQLDRWAQHNDALWSETTRYSHIGCVTEYDRLRILCAALLRLKVDTDAKRMEHARLHGSAPY